MKALWLMTFAALAACHSPLSRDPRIASAFAGVDAAPTPLVTAAALATEGDGPRARISAGVEVGAAAGSSASLVAVEGELAVGNHLAVVPRLVHYNYSWEGEGDFTDEATEKGDGTGAGVELRFYPKQALDGIYVGLGAAAFPVNDWEYRDGSYREAGDSTTFTVYASGGYMIRLGEHFSLGPTALVGSFLSDSPETGVFAGIGLRFGIDF